jgi:hypothetical protein
MSDIIKGKLFDIARYHNFGFGNFTPPGPVNELRYKKTVVDVTKLYASYNPDELEKDTFKKEWNNILYGRYLAVQKWFKTGDEIVEFIAMLTRWTKEIQPPVPQFFFDAIDNIRIEELSRLI